MSGLLLLDKPTGFTSHDMVAVVRRGTGVKRVGHAGTLDPLATGLLVVCVGAATRLSEFLIGTDKRYRARVRLGQTTNTYDAEGQITSESGQLPTREAVEKALVQFRGHIQQRPPAFSAVKRGGQKAYELARRGQPVDLPPRPVEVHALELTEWQPPELSLDVLCSAGTYIRSLAHDLGQALGCGAHLAGLRRTHSGTFSVSEALRYDQLQEAFAEGAWPRVLRPADAAVAQWPEVVLSEEQASRIRHGRAIPLDQHADDWARAYDPSGAFIAVLRADVSASVWRPYKVLAGAGASGD